MFLKRKRPRTEDYVIKKTRCEGKILKYLNNLVLADTLTKIS